MGKEHIVGTDFKVDELLEMVQQNIPLTEEQAEALDDLYGFGERIMDDPEQVDLATSMTSVISYDATIGRYHILNRNIYDLMVEDKKKLNEEMVEHQVMDFRIGDDDIYVIQASSYSKAFGFARAKALKGQLGFKGHWRWQRRSGYIGKTIYATELALNITQIELFKGDTSIDYYTFPRDKTEFTFDDFDESYPKGIYHIKVKSAHRHAEATIELKEDAYIYIDFIDNQKELQIDVTQKKDEKKAQAREDKIYFEKEDLQDPRENSELVEFIRPGYSKGKYFYKAKNSKDEIKTQFYFRPAYVKEFNKLAEGNQTDMDSYTSYLRDDEIYMISLKARKNALWSVASGSVITDSEEVFVNKLLINIMPHEIPQLKAQLDWNNDALYKKIAGIFGVAEERKKFYATMNKYGYINTGRIAIVRNSKKNNKWDLDTQVYYLGPKDFSTFSLLELSDIMKQIAIIDTWVGEDESETVIRILKSFMDSDMLTEFESISSNSQLSQQTKTIKLNSRGKDLDTLEARKRIDAFFNYLHSNDYSSLYSGLINRLDSDYLKDYYNILALFYPHKADLSKLKHLNYLIDNENKVFWDWEKRDNRYEIGDADNFITKHFTNFDFKQFEIYDLTLGDKNLYDYDQSIVKQINDSKTTAPEKEKLLNKRQAQEPKQPFGSFRIKVVQNLLDGATMDDDETAIIKVFTYWSDISSWTVAAKKNIITWMMANNLTKLKKLHADFHGPEYDGLKNALSQIFETDDRYANLLVKILDGKADPTRVTRRGIAIYPDIEVVAFYAPASAFMKLGQEHRVKLIKQIEAGVWTDWDDEDTILRMLKVVENNQHLAPETFDDEDYTFMRDGFNKGMANDKFKLAILQDLWRYTFEELSAPAEFTKDDKKKLSDTLLKRLQKKSFETNHLKAVYVLIRQGIEDTKSFYKELEDQVGLEEVLDDLDGDSHIKGVNYIHAHDSEANSDKRLEIARDYCNKGFFGNADAKVADLSERDLAKATLEDRELFLKTLVGWFSRVGDRDEKSIIRIIKTTPNTDLEGMLRLLSDDEGELYQDIHDAVDGGNFKSFHDVLYEISLRHFQENVNKALFGGDGKDFSEKYKDNPKAMSKAVKKELQRRKDDIAAMKKLGTAHNRVFPWSDPGILNIFADEIVYSAEWTEKNKIALTITVNGNIPGNLGLGALSWLESVHAWANRGTVILDPGEIIGIEFLEPDSELGGKKGDVKIMTAFNVFQLINKQESQDMSELLDVIFLVIGILTIEFGVGAFFLAMAIGDIIITTASLINTSFKEYYPAEVSNALNYVNLVFGIGSLLLLAPQGLKNALTAINRLKAVVRTAKMTSQQLKKIKAIIRSLEKQVETFEVVKKKNFDELIEFRRGLTEMAGDPHIDDLIKQVDGLMDLKKPKKPKLSTEEKLKALEDAKAKRAAQAANATDAVPKTSNTRNFFDKFDDYLQNIQNNSKIKAQAHSETFQQKLADLKSRFMNNEPALAIYADGTGTLRWSPDNLNLLYMWVPEFKKSVEAFTQASRMLSKLIPNGSPSDIIKLLKETAVHGFKAGVFHSQEAFIKYCRLHFVENLAKLGDNIEDQLRNIFDEGKKGANNIDEFKDAVLGEKINSGQDKVVYHLKDHPDLVIGILKPEAATKEGLELLKKEIDAINELKETGIPTIEILGTTTHNGIPAVIMKKYAGGYKPHIPDMMDLHLLNQDSIKDLNKMREIINERGIYVHDIEFLIKSDGKMVIADPLGVKIEAANDLVRQTIREIDDAIEAATENILTTSMKPGIGYSYEELNQLLGGLVEKDVLENFLSMATHPRFNVITIKDGKYFIN